MGFFYIIILQKKAGGSVVSMLCLKRVRPRPLYDLYSFIGLLETNLCHKKKKLETNLTGFFITRVSWCVEDGLVGSIIS